ncbi:MAG: carboxypeptidase-like regulatory domain-containing protein, partial [Prevotellaceae bacterium]|nr:carboxypeptidase-like regulatory domain-containing protein [Prevotellaceae bacterium]
MRSSKNLFLFGRAEQLRRLCFMVLLSVLAIGAYAQNKSVTGTVVDTTGESVIGASVLVQGTTNGTITDF